MAQIPTPLRAALGLTATAIEGARTLPDKIVEFPVMLVSTALQVSLRAQQRYAEYITRGDEVIGRLHGLPEEPPSWATFDDEDAAEAGEGSAEAGDRSAEAGDRSAEAGDRSAEAGEGSAQVGSETATETAEAGEAGASVHTIGVDDEAGPRPRSAGKRPRTAKKAPSAAKRTSKANAKKVPPPRKAKPSAFDAVGDAGSPDA